jgi:hypothetical protein
MLPERRRRGASDFALGDPFQNPCLVKIGVVGTSTAGFDQDLCDPKTETIAGIWDFQRRWWFANRHGKSGQR